MTAYYNELDPHAAQWLRNLISAGAIAPGDVDERSIEDVTPNDLRGYTQCHFFAGIGGWAYALDLAGWPRDRPVWTGSCPCQPFSAAGKGAGFADERHLWPAWQHLINQCRPPVIFGEQVASKAVDAWIDLVHTDMEGMGYAFGSVPFPAAGVGAPHIRDRNYWLGHACGSRSAAGVSAPTRGHERFAGIADHTGSQLPHGGQRPAHPGVEFGGLGNAAGTDGERHAGSISGAQAAVGGPRIFNGDQPFGLEHAGAGVLRLADAEHDGHNRPFRLEAQPHCDESNERLSDRNSAAFGLADAEGGGRARELLRTGNGMPQDGVTKDRDTGERTGPTNGHWRHADWLGCRDGKWRPVEPGTFPLAHGVSGRVGLLRGYGNAIVPEAAAAFVSAYAEAVGIRSESALDLFAA